MKHAAHPIRVFLLRAGLSIWMGLLFLCLCIAPAAAERVVLPQSLRIISAEAFLGDTGITSVMLPEGIEEIRSRAFAGSAITSLNLPSSITYIADDAFDACDLQSVTAEEGSYAYDWCTERGLFIMPPETDPAYFAYGMLEDGTCEITSSYEYKTSIVLPAYSPDGIPVTRISRYAFSSSDLESVVIPSSIQEIGEGAFSNCEQLTNVQMFDGLRKIEDYAFSECTALETLWLPNSVEEIGHRAFLSCTSLQRSNYPLNLTTYGYQPWDDCINLTLTIPEGVTSIPDYFFNSFEIYGVVLPESMIDYPLFMHCANLKSITLPKNMKQIPESMFYGCSGLEQITLPEALEGIESYAFANCSSLKEIYFPDSLVQLEGCAFYNCASLEKANYPINWTINVNGDSPFIACPMLKEFIVPEGVTQLAEGVFSRFYSLEYVYLPDSLPELSNYIFCDKVNLKSVRLPNGLKAIPYHAFDGCTSLEDIILPDSVETIDEYAFYNCSSLKKINYPINCSTAAYDLVGGSTDEYIHISPFEGCTSLSEIIIPEGVNQIPPFAFYNCDAITELSFPTTITDIGEQAFGHCDSLNHINYPINWKNVSFNSDAVSPFVDCPSLTRVVIPEGVTTIASHAFDGCSNLREVSFPSTLVNSGQYAFQDCSSLTEISLPDSTINISWGSFSGCINLSTVTLPENLNAIDGNAFSGCSRLRSIEFPDTLEFIGNYAFSGCSSLESAMLPDSVTSIGGYAFSGCTSLSKVHYPVSLGGYGYNGSIFSGCFAGCPNLTNIAIPEGVTHIPAWFFWDSSIEYISFPSTLDEVGAYAFGSYYDDDCPLKGIHFEENCQFWSYANSFPEIEGITVYGTAGSYAETFAANRGYAFSTAPFPGFKEDEPNEPDEPETPNAITFSGYVTFGDGTPLEGAEIYAYNAAEEIIAYDYTDENGAWDCEVIPDEQCTIRYHHDVYTIEPAEVSVITGDDLVFDTAIASVGGVYGPAVPSFTMQANGSSIPAEGVMVGDPVTFAITANNMPKVRLVVDGRIYDEYALTGGSAVVDRSFSRAGERAVAFQAYTGMFWTVPCEAQTLIVYEDTALDAPEILSPYEDEILPGKNVEILWDQQPAAQEYRLTIYRITGEKETAVISDLPVTGGAYTFSADPGQSYRAALTAIAGDQRLTCTRSFSTLAENLLPQVTGFEMSVASAVTGEKIVFTVSVQNASMVQLIADGSTYDVFAAEDGTATLTRAFTQAGSRAIAFRAYGNGVWSSPCAAQTLEITANAQLDAPVVSCGEKIWVGNALTVSWDAVENADGYTVYLTDTNGNIHQWEHGRNLRTRTIDASHFASPGECSVLVMAYGAGYSQSSARTYIEVTDEYIPWQGWVQAATANTYDTAACTTINGYVDYIDPVTVLGEEDSAYLIEMTLTGGGTAQRYVMRSAIGTEPFTPDLTLNASYEMSGETVILRAKTNLVGVRAGVSLNGNELGSVSHPQASTTYTRTFKFSLTAPAAETVYTVWAEDGFGHRLTKDVTVPAYVTATPTPEITPTPTPAPTPTPGAAVTPRPEITITPAPVIEDEAVALPSQPEESAEPAACPLIVGGVHPVAVYALKDMNILCRDDGTILMQDSVCTQCGAHVRGAIPDNIIMPFGYHSILGYYDTNANGNGSYAHNSEFASLLVNSSLTITDDLDLNGAPLYVSGKLTLEGDLTNAGRISCGELEIKQGALLEISGMLDVAGKIVINGTLSGAKHVECDGRFTVGTSGIMAFDPPFKLRAGDRFEFSSSHAHDAYFSADSSIIAKGMKIGGKQFRFPGTFCSMDIFSAYSPSEKETLSINMGDAANYVGHLDLSQAYPLIKYDSGSDSAEVNWSSLNKYRAKKVSYNLYDLSADDYLIEAYEGATVNGNLFLPKTDESGRIDRDYYARAVELDMGIINPEAQLEYEIVFNYNLDGGLADFAREAIISVMGYDEITPKQVDDGGIIRIGSIEYILTTSSDTETGIDSRGEEWEITYTGFNSIVGSSISSAVSKVEMFSGSATWENYTTGFTVYTTQAELQESAAAIVSVSKAEIERMRDDTIQKLVDEAQRMLLVKGIGDAIDWYKLGDAWSINATSLQTGKDLLDSLIKYRGHYNKIKRYSNMVYSIEPYHDLMKGQ